MEDRKAYMKPVIHRMTRRAVWHDYRSPCKYMITISKEEGAPWFGRVRNIASPQDAYIELTDVGRVVAEEILATTTHHPEILILRQAVMPDHFHALIYVTARLRKELGDIVQALKGATTSRIRKALGSPTLVVFKKGFNDRIIKKQEQLETVDKYIRDNPRRLAVRRAFPEYFRRVNELTVCGVRVQAYGNFQLLENPFKEQVVVHRADTPEERERNRERWLYTAANRGVLVSPFISPAEKGIRAEAEALGGRFILITAEPFGERYKPAAHNFALCEAGNLLIISAPAKDLTRQQCLAMNRLAGQIARAVHPFGNNR